ncbi:MAG: hypothetical protein AAF664_07605 [Planctomycetota bacterium]
MATLYQHRFDDVADYLHHRPPYLLIDSIESISDDAVKAFHTVDPESFFIRGHFPGAAVLPGAMMQEMTTQAGGVLIAANFNPMADYNTHDPHHNELALGVLVKIKHGRYRGFARPGDKLSIEVTLDDHIGDVFDFHGLIRCNDQLIYKNAFQLTNLPSDTLR